MAPSSPERRPLESVERHLPLKPVVFQMLLALADAELHGYGIIQAVRTQSGGRIRLQTGPFYRHLKRLLEDGWVEETHANRPDDDPRRGAYYRLTTPGRVLVAAEGRRLTELVHATQSLGFLAKPNSSDS